MHLGIVIAFKNTTFSAPKSAPETALESTYFVIFQEIDKNLEKKLVIIFVLRSSFLWKLDFLFLEETPQSCLAGKKMCL